MGSSDNEPSSERSSGPRSQPRSEPRSGSFSTRSSRASRWILAAAILGSALAVGTVHTVTLCIVTAALAAAVALAWWKAEPARSRSSATLLLFTGIGLTVFTALQCVPLPAGVLASIAPHNADVWSRVLSPLHEAGPRWAPISLDPTATRVEVLKGVAYLLAFVAALRVSRRKDGVAFLSAVIVVAALVLAVSALLHPAFGAKRLFGVYDPGPGIAERHVAPLMNANNLAGYLNLAFCLALGASVSIEPRLPRPILAAVALLLAATQVWIASRAGVITMVLGAVIVVGVARLARSKAGRGVAALSIGTGLAAAIGGAMVVLGGSDEASFELLDADVSKLAMFRHAMKMLPAMPFFGCGRGAFESAFPAFRLDSGHVTFAYPENVVAQWTLEWGLPVALAGGLLVAFALRPNAVLARSSLASGAWAGLVALFVQNLGDLGTEIPGLVLAAVVCAAIVAGGSPGHRDGPRADRWGEHTRLVPALGVAMATAAIAVAATGVGHELHEEQRTLHDAALTRRLPEDALVSLERAAMTRHPAEPYLPFAMALRKTAAHEDSALPWIAATIERAKVYGPAHLALARLIWPRSSRQAMLEYRLAMEQAPGLIELVLDEASRLVRSYDDAVELVPSGSMGPGVLDSLAARLASRLPSTSVRLDERLAALSPPVTTPAARGVVLRRAELATLDVEAAGATPWCDGLQRDACEKGAVAAARSYQGLAPEECAGYEMEARARAAVGDPGGLTVLAGAVDRARDRLECLQALTRVSDRMHDDAGAESALTRIVAMGCATEAECAKNLAWVAAEEEMHGRPAKAKALYKRAYDQAPETSSLLENVGRLAAAQGLHVEAADVYTTLARKFPATARYREAAEKERAAAARDFLR
jgi:hypothetical protein